MGVLNVGATAAVGAVGVSPLRPRLELALEDLPELEVATKAIAAASMAQQALVDRFFDKLEPDRSAAVGLELRTVQREYAHMEVKQEAAYAQATTAKQAL